MPKQLGFDLYALTVHYRDGDTCVCYARKTANWYYFSDKMDFRIQLAGDNHTITKQEWRRKHYDYSWYESGLLDYVDLMTFGELYLQSELNPMRTDISNNHTTIVNNYNTFKTFVNSVTDVTNSDSVDDYVKSTISLLHFWSTNLSDMIFKLTKSIGDLFENFRKLRMAFAEIVRYADDWVNPLGAEYYFPDYLASIEYFPMNVLDEYGNVATIIIELPNIRKLYDAHVFTDNEWDGYSEHTVPTAAVDYNKLERRIAELERNKKE